ncbi:peptidoglycan-binding protein [Streptomyces kunmingensis]|uniref:Peptidoglycan-binding protein n=1 Tax=Streptomyces kunmingensis TaxID=68225 RepID=A0ABU6CKA0_9ACTN|nr:peptidoglycan-binding domain-containing protein [Streptomyces kunmingensis]MEB3965118.1 peptidoglycan-binding protein [Streptomyces kunmingensis]
MRTSILRRRLVPTAVAVALTVGTLVGAAPALAAPQPAATVAVEDIGAQAVVNLGLTVRKAKGVQTWLKRFHDVYDGRIDGALGTDSWIGIQRVLAIYHGYEGDFDGDPGAQTKRALQRFLNYNGYNAGKVDGIWGSQSTNAWATFADAMVDYYNIP